MGKVKFREIKEYAKKLKQKFNPQNIILFGSYAKKRVKEDSDVDLLVIMEAKLRCIEQAALIRKQIPSSFPLDLIVRKPQEVRERLKKGDYFLETVLREGKKL